MFGELKVSGSYLPNPNTSIFNFFTIYFARAEPSNLSSLIYNNNYVILDVTYLNLKKYIENLKLIVIWIFLKINNL